ncbi:MAG: rod shape-determining protein [Deltaproteobacteria bacterium]|nr:rod shape-determining protein [Deltaproteobacteria bacterium]MBW1816470.1 rod shape-determining protein [Deltaproteobacteria bacterium]MBW2283222.1 rod shape-determining protein [Deltaproteobacteria bacterium]
MITVGIDVGAQSVAAVALDGDRILAEVVLTTEETTDAAARRVFRQLLDQAGLEAGQVERTIATGWEADEVPLADDTSSEQVCTALAARFLVPTARTVIDMGAEGCRVMKLDPGGILEDFANNSKCASGTGSFLELGAVYLKTPIEELGPLSLTADGAAEVSTICAVFAESVIISHIHQGESRARIAAGIHRAAASRAAELVGRVGLVEDVVMIGGAALNAGLVKAMEDLIGVKIHVPPSPQTAAALGAAIKASKKKRRRKKRPRPKSE